MQEGESGDASTAARSKRAGLEVVVILDVFCSLEKNWLFKSG